MSQKPYILIVEDDYLNEEEIRRKIKQTMNGVDIDTIATELDFRNQLNDLVAHPPVAIVMDIMLAWEEPTPTPTVRPEQVESEGISRAGFRCIDLLTERHVTVPIKIYSAHLNDEREEDLKNLPPHVSYQSKREDLEPFFQEISKLLT